MVSNFNAPKKSIPTSRINCREISFSFFIIILEIEIISVVSLENY